MKNLLIVAIVQILGLVICNEVALKEFINGNRLLTAAIYKEIAKENIGSNILVSPFSIETILALVQAGALDETAHEIRTSLGLPNTKEKVDAVYTNLLPNLKGNEFYDLLSANKIYVQNGFSLKENFKNVATKTYQADVENVDFSAKVQTAESINSWVEKQTKNKIQNLIDPELIDDLTRVILVNALYFKGKWTHPFEKISTKKKAFYTSKSNVVQVETMHNTDLYNYYESSELNAKFLEMPYEGDDVSMVIVLPNEKDGLKALESQIDRVFTAPNFTQERVNVALPRFSIDYKINLNSLLKKLGIVKAFTSDADLSGIAGEKGDLTISKVLQKSFINVTESGTEAAAATAVTVVNFSAPFEDPAEKIINVDHPFFFYIATKQVILFTGKIVFPLH